MAEFKNLQDVLRLTEDQARNYLEAIRWPQGAICAHCQSKEVTKLQGKSTRSGVYKCKPCQKQFTVSVGTIFEGSHIPLSKWVGAFYLMCGSKKGVSSNQLHRDLGITYKSAWFLTHRIRYAMKKGVFGKLTGIVEADETFCGGKVRNSGGKWAHAKTAVMTLIQRGGEARTVVIGRVTKNNVEKALLENVEP